MTAHTPSQAPLISPVLQRLILVKVTGQKTRTRDPVAFPATTAKLLEEVAH